MPSFSWVAVWMLCLSRSHRAIGVFCSLVCEYIRNCNSRKKVISNIFYSVAWDWVCNNGSNLLERPLTLLTEKCYTVLFLYFEVFLLYRGSKGKVINDGGLLTLAVCKLLVGFESKRVKMLNACTSELSHTLNFPVCTCACTRVLVDRCFGIV